MLRSNQNNKMRKRVIMQGLDELCKLQTRLLFSNSCVMSSCDNAKNNIGLNIVGKRSDGYHLLESVFYPFPLYDIIEITDAPNAVETTLTITGLDLSVRSDNLCLQAYHLLAEK